MHDRDLSLCAAGAVPQLTDSQFGLLVGASLQDVAHVVAVAPAHVGMDGDAMSSTLLIKMARVSLLGIVAIILGILFTQPDPETGKRGRMKFPARKGTDFVVSLVRLLHLRNSYIGEKSVS